MAILAPFISKYSGKAVSGPFMVMGEQKHSPDISRLGGKGIMHAPYICKPFSMNNLRKAKFIISKLVEECDRLKIDHILFHLPQSQEEMIYFKEGMNNIKSIVPKTMTIHLEIPAFNKAFMNTVDPAKYINKYFDIVEKDMEENMFYCMDTAHLWSNGLLVDDMIKLIENKKDRIGSIHLNGNLRKRFDKDQHVAFFSKENAIKDMDKLVKYLAKTDFVMIAEVTTRQEKDKNIFDSNTVEEIKAKPPTKLSKNDWKKMAKHYELEFSDAWSLPGASF